MADELTKEDVQTQHELGSVRDGSAANEGMRPAEETTVDPLDVDGTKKTDPAAQKPNYGVKEGQKTAAVNHAEEQVIHDEFHEDENDFEPIEQGQADAAKNSQEFEGEANKYDPIADGKKTAARNVKLEKAEARRRAADNS